MSAWVPCKEHIDLLVRVADVLRDRIPVAIPEDRAALGQMLTDEVVASVSARYPGDDVAAGELPGPMPPYDFYNRAYVYADHGFMPDAAEMRKLVSCYAYQACEHDGWESSTANAVCEGILAALGKGESAGPWGWDEESVAARVEQGKPFVGDFHPTYA